VTTATTTNVEDLITIEVVDGGIYFYMTGEPRPAKPLTMTEARSALDSSMTAAMLNVARVAKLERALKDLEKRNAFELGRDYERGQR
jgi:hypothetical protein